MVAHDSDDTWSDDSTSTSILILFLSLEFEIKLQTLTAFRFCDNVNLYAAESSLLEAQKKKS